MWLISGTHWKEYRGIDETFITWDCFSENCIDRFFLRELSESKVEEFINLRQGNMMVKEYVLKFNQLSKYAPHIIVDSRS